MKKRLNRKVKIVGALFTSRGDKATAIICQRNCSDQVSSQTRLEHISTDAYFQGGVTRITILLDREENNSCGRLGFYHTFGCFDATEDRHGKIKHDDIRLQLGSGVHSCLPLSYSTND